MLSTYHYSENLTCLSRFAFLQVGLSNDISALSRKNNDLKVCENE